jgi:hyperosmotically inducible protein
MNTFLKNRFLALGLTVASLPAFLGASTGSNAPDLTNRVRHELVMLPYYTIFDDLSFRVDGNTVTLLGEVRRPVLKDDAQRVVQRIPGVSAVVNNIKVLPVSFFDDRIRAATARAIYRYAPLERYSLGARPPIHIVVENGNVTLSGSVGNEMDKNLAFMRANQVSGVFSVTNNLLVDFPLAK